MLRWLMGALVVTAGCGGAPEAQPREIALVISARTDGEIEPCG